MGLFPNALHICTYDVRGQSTATGTARTVRETGLVTHTHQLLQGLAVRRPDIRLALTRTGAAGPEPVDELLTPQGQRVQLRAIATRFPQYLAAPGGGKSSAQVRRYYEQEIGQADNPVWRSLAAQYAAAVLDAGIPDLLAQNTNPIVAILKAIEFGLLDPSVLGGLALAGVVHDTAGCERRFGYIAEQLRAGAPLRLVAVSQAVARGLLAAGVPAETVNTVPNGMDTAGFGDRLRRVREAAVFERVRVRNGVPRAARIVLVSARRVRWKGAQDVVEAAALLVARGRMRDAVVVVNGAGLLDSRDPGYQDELARLVRERGLENVVFLLDELSADEVAACYTAAHLAAHPSREPEPWGYSNLEAMLAGVPVIAAGHGGPLEYINDGESGLLVAPQAPQELARAIDAVLSDAELHARLAAAGRSSARRFTLEAMLEGYEAVLGEGAAARTDTVGAR
jgi:glycosyltransferase involved in cell wall biosynthesis